MAYYGCVSRRERSSGDVRDGRIVRRLLLSTISRFPRLSARLRRAQDKVLALRAHHDPSSRVSEFWGDESSTWKRGGALHWTELLQIERRINGRVSGSPDVDPYMYFISKYLADRLPVERALTLGCGTGELERSAVLRYGPGFTRRHDAFDIAKESIRRASEAAREMGLSHIHYEVRDIDSIELPADTYDCIAGAHSVHHFARLEHVFSEVRKALKPGGYFVLNEFVGPTQFQWSDRQLEVINGLLCALPSRLRRSCSDGKMFKKPVERPTIVQMNRIDPSEAIRSADILPLLPRYFDVLEVKGYGGAVLHLLLDDIAGNFQQPDDSTAGLLDALCEVEERLTSMGDVANDFALVIARKP